MHQIWNKKIRAIAKKHDTTVRIVDEIVRKLRKVYEEKNFVNQTYSQKVVLDKPDQYTEPGTALCYMQQSEAKDTNEVIDEQIFPNEPIFNRIST